MSEPFIGEVRIFAGTFAPRGWALCNGQIISIAQNTALFSLLGTTFGGDGRTTFGLPDLGGRVPMHPGQGPGLTSRRLGEAGGATEVTLSEAQIPSHAHRLQTASAEADEDDPGGKVMAATSEPMYASGVGTELLAAQAVGTTGGGQAHNNLQPYTVVQFIIALQGIYPSRS